MNHPSVSAVKVTSQLYYIFKQSYGQFGCEWSFQNLDQEWVEIQSISSGLL